MKEKLVKLIFPEFTYDFHFETKYKEGKKNIVKDVDVSCFKVKSFGRKYISIWGEPYSKKVIIDDVSRKLIKNNFYFVLAYKMSTVSSYGTISNYKLLEVITENDYYDYLQKLRLIRCFLYFEKNREKMDIDELRDNLKKLKNMIKRKPELNNIFNELKMDVTSGVYEKTLKEKIFYIEYFYKNNILTKSEYEKVVLILDPSENDYRAALKIIGSLNYKIASLDKKINKLWNYFLYKDILQENNSYKFTIYEYNIAKKNGVWKIKREKEKKYYNSFNTAKQALYFLATDNNWVPRN